VSIAPLNLEREHEGTPVESSCGCSSVVGAFDGAIRRLATRDGEVEPFLCCLDFLRVRNRPLEQRLERRLQ